MRILHGDPDDDRIMPSPKRTFPIGKNRLDIVRLWLRISRTGNQTSHDIHSITSTTRRCTACRSQAARANAAPVGAGGWGTSRASTRFFATRCRQGPGWVVGVSSVARAFRKLSRPEKFANLPCLYAPSRSLENCCVIARHLKGKGLHDTLIGSLAISSNSSIEG